MRVTNKYGVTEIFRWRIDISWDSSAQYAENSLEFVMCVSLYGKYTEPYHKVMVF